MTPKYWAGIAATMLAIFAVGMAVRNGFHRVETFATDNFPAPLMLLKSGFRLDGDRVGDIQRMQFMRSNPGEVDSAVFTVRIDDSADVQRLASCTLRATGGHPFGSSTRFLCTSHSDSARLNLVPFGHIEIEPGGQDVTFYVASDVAGDMHAHAYRGKGSGDSGNVDIHVGDGSFSMTVNGKQFVQAGGDSSGGSLVIRDDQGNPILQVNGDSAGGSVRITDSHGKKILDIHGSGSSKAGSH